MKRTHCTKCGKPRDDGFFHATCKECRYKQLNNYYHSNRARYVAWRNKCRARNVERERETQNAWMKANPDKLRGYRAKRNHGLSFPEYMKLAAIPLCEICGTVLSTKGRTRRTIDHCHKSTKIRGVLCHNCNCALGYFADNVTAMTRAIAYLCKSYAA